MIRQLSLPVVLPVFDTSDVPGGVINIVTGTRKELAPVLAAHDDVDGVWFYGPRAEAAEVERLSAGNMKRSHVSWNEVDWADVHEGQVDAIAMKGNRSGRDPLAIDAGHGFSRLSIRQSGKDSSLDDLNPDEVPRALRLPARYE